MILCYDGHMEWTSFAVTSLGKQNILLGFTWLWEHNLPRPKSMPRSTPIPRFKSKPRYPLYSSLVFCYSQAPISHHNPIDLPSLAKASFITHALCDVSTDSDEVAAFHFQPHTLATGNHSVKEANLSSSFLFIPYPFSILHSCFNIPDPC